VRARFATKHTAITKKSESTRSVFGIISQTNAALQICGGFCDRHFEPRSRSGRGGDFDQTGESCGAMSVTMKQQHDGTRSPGGVYCAGDDPFELKAQLVDFARELGFDSCRTTSCAVPAHAQEFQ